MAFFGLTGLGYQDPFRAARPQEEEHPGQCSQTGKCEKSKSQTTLPAIVPPSTYLSHKKYQETVRRHQALITPKETQRLPLTAAQRYGWWVPLDPNVKAEYVHTWIEAPRYPMINSPMTRCPLAAISCRDEYRIDLKDHCVMLSFLRDITSGACPVLAPGAAIFSLRRGRHSKRAHVQLQAIGFLQTSLLKAKVSQHKVMGISH